MQPASPRRPVPIKPKVAGSGTAGGSGGSDGSDGSAASAENFEKEAN